MRNDIFINYGNDAYSMTLELLNAIKPQVKNYDSVVLKPNLVLAKEAKYGATTHVEIAKAVIDYFRNLGIHNIKIAEGAWVGANTENAFKICGYKALDVPLVDLKKDEFIKYDIDGVDIEYCKTIKEADYLINLPVIKGHCQTKITCALKNMKGCISDNSKRHFHNIGLHKPIACLNKIKSANLIIADGICGDLDFEEGGNPVESNMIIAGFDSVLIDSYAAKLLGYMPHEIKHIELAEKYGIGNTSGEHLHFLNEAYSKPVTSERKTLGLQKYIKDNNACSACYAACIRALYNTQSREVLYVGQGYKETKKDALGIGNCTQGFTTCIKGCPPKAVDIVQYLQKN